MQRRSKEQFFQTCSFMSFSMKMRRDGKYSMTGSWFHSTCMLGIVKSQSLILSPSNIHFHRIWYPAMMTSTEQCSYSDEAAQFQTRRSSAFEYHPRDIKEGSSEGETTSTIYRRQCTCIKKTHPCSSEPCDRIRSIPNQVTKSTVVNSSLFWSSIIMDYNWPMWSLWSDHPSLCGRTY